MDTFRLSHFDICSGIGGFAIAFEAEGFTTVGFAETDPDANLVTSYHWPHVKNYGDIKQITKAILKETGPIDVLTGGIPCQPASLLGKRRGTSDERWLWPATIKLVSELRPGVCLFENPAALLTLEDGRAFNGIVSSLSTLGYDCWWEPIPAAAFGAGHLRWRIFLVCVNSAYTRRARRQQIAGCASRPQSTDERRAALSNHQSERVSEVGATPDAQGKSERVASNEAAAQHEGRTTPATSPGDGNRSLAADSDSRGRIAGTRLRESGESKRRRRRSSDACQPGTTANADVEGLEGRAEHEQSAGRRSRRSRHTADPKSVRGIAADDLRSRRGKVGTRRSAGNDSGLGVEALQGGQEEQARQSANTDDQGSPESRLHVSRGQSRSAVSDAAGGCRCGECATCTGADASSAASGQRGQESRGPGVSSRLADLRGRVEGTDWWHEARSGIPVLVNGLPSKLVEATTRCTGNAVVPACVQPFAAAIREWLYEQRD